MREKKKVWDDHPSLKSSNKKNERLKPTTINTRLRTLKAQFNFWYKNHFISENLAEKIKLLKTEKEIKPFKDEDARRILAVVEKETKYSELRNYVIILLLIDTGVRIEQLLNVKMSDVDLVRREIYLSAEKSKTRDDHILLFSPKTKLWLDALIKENNKYNFKEDNYLFVNVKTGEKYQSDAFRKALKRYSEIAGLKGLTLSPHMFRYFFATTFIKNGGDIFELKELLNHKNVQTTIRYVSTSKEHIKNSHLKYSPINQIT